MLLHYNVDLVSPLLRRDSPMTQHVATDMQQRARLFGGCVWGHADVLYAGNVWPLGTLVLFHCPLPLQFALCCLNSLDSRRIREHRQMAGSYCGILQTEGAR